MARPIIRLKISHRGKTLEQFRKDMLRIRKLIREKIVLFSNDITKYIQTTILLNIKRPTALNKRGLISAFAPESVYVRFYGDKMIIGIGDLKLLNSKFPYWKAVNDGGKIPPPAYGWFGARHRPSPSMVGKGKERFFKRSKAQGGFKMVPRVPMRPMHYIEKTQNWLSKRWGSRWTAYLSKTIKKF